MKEFFKESKTSGSIKINLEEKGVWECEKSDILNYITEICEEYQENGYTLTLRQMYYQLVSKDYIPNHDKAYKKIGKLKDELCYSGEIDWSIFEDRGRVPHTPWYEDSVIDALEDTATRFRLERQKNQPIHVEVWTEKDAISSILKNVTNRYGVTLVVNKGYTSSTAIYSAYERFMDRIENNNQKIAIKYFGDHDPSGLDMVRDVYDRLMFMFVNGEMAKSYNFKKKINLWAYNSELGFQHEDSEMTDVCGEYFFDEDCQTEYVYLDGEKEVLFDEVKAFFKHHFTIEQIGLTMEQIKKYNPPPNPAKMTDSRADAYVAKFGKVSWEVDALRPQVMEEIVKNSIIDTIDMDLFKDTMEEEEKDKVLIKDFIKKINK